MSTEIGKGKGNPGAIPNQESKQDASPATKDKATNTTAPTTNTTRVCTVFHYGILATGRSWLIGVRKLVRREHATMLVSRIAGPSLPQELVDLIVEELCERDEPVLCRKIEAAAKWRPGERDGFHWEPSKSRKGMPVDRAVQKMLDDSGVLVTRIECNHNIPHSLNPLTGGLVTLRASAQPEFQLGIVCTSGSPASDIHRQDDYKSDGRKTEWESFKNGDEKVISRCFPNDVADGWPSRDESMYNVPAALQRGRWGVGRHLHVSCLEEVTASWDGEAAERLIRKLGLEVVKASSRGGDPMKPSLVCYQGLGVDRRWEQRWDDMQRWDDWADLSRVPDLLEEKRREAEEKRREAQDLDDD